MGRSEVAMQPFWDVLWADSLALAGFVGRMLALALPASLLTALIAEVFCGVRSARRYWAAAAYGTAGGVLAALGLSMLIEYALKVEGLLNGRRAMQDATTIQLIVAAPLAAIAVTFLSVRRMAPPRRTHADRRFSLRVLFLGQLVAAILLGWWAYTRRDEISQRRTLLQWQSVDQQAKAVFEPLGWWVETGAGGSEVQLSAAPHYKPISDESLRPVGAQERVTHVIIKSDDLTDRGLSHLRRASRLRRLYVKSAQVTDVGIAPLSQLPRLRYLEIHCSQVTGLCLKPLAELRSLRYLVIQSPHVSEQDEAAFRVARPGVDVRILRE